MRQQLVMDHTGHSTHAFSEADRVSVQEAEKRFAELTGKGYRAVALGANGEPGTVLKAFDATVERTLFMPQLQGG